MDITKFDYHIVGDKVVKNFAGEPFNVDTNPEAWAEYQEWLAAGGVPEPQGAWESLELDHIRKYRDYELKKTDWMMLEDIAMDPTVKQSLIEYRQALRDLPSTFVYGQPVVWPEKPIL